GATDAQDQALQRFGQAMGLAFQIQDDILGIWGDPAVTGKAAGNDILRRKKSLPLLYALNHETVGPQLQALWQEDLGAEQLPLVLQLLAETDARQFAQEQFDHHHHVGIAALHDALGDRAASSALLALANSLLHRES
ncbi:MAG: polyprenyl synthetase family protein, partial [Caldilineaceae bacterium]|nr:polyprenyl synthetase family protein [Caldilineaceae bacterium]